MYKLMILFTCVILIGSTTYASQDGAHDAADAIRMLQELDRYYSHASRPRIGRREAPSRDSIDPVTLDRAVRLLQLQSLDRYYSYQTRPRFGKRANGNNLFSKIANELGSPVYSEWDSAPTRR